ncbi:MAG TPA: 5-formyltetrahydrofolate cyclo-ligase [Actinomycetota bacterium]|jgi:5-formyltetrahydrofolate cyclo-ligase
MSDPHPPPAHRLKREKRSLRRAVLAERDAMTSRERDAASEAIAERFAGLPEAKRARTVLAFWSFGSEVDTAPLIDRLVAAGSSIALPRLEGTEMTAVGWSPGDPVTTASFGAMEPASGRAVDPASIDLVVVPGVAFDRAGGRVGYGGGYYDRFLGRLRPGVPAIAVAFDHQIVDRVPSGRGDRSVDAIVTEREIIRCRSSRTSAT